MPVEKDYDLILLEKPEEGALELSEINQMLKLMDKEHIYCMIEVQTDHSVASGFIKSDKFEQMDYDQAKIQAIIRSLMDDMNLTNKYNEYVLIVNADDFITKETKNIKIRTYFGTYLPD